MANIRITPVSTSRKDKVDFNNLSFGRIFSDHMFVADFNDGQWQDYRIVPVEKMQIHPANMALHYGQSIFEGMKAGRDKEGNPVLFRPENNFERLNTSALRMCMPEFSVKDAMEALKTLLLLDKEWIPNSPGSSMYIRPFMYATDEYLGVAPSTSYRFVILLSPSGAYYSKPVSLLVQDQYVRAVLGGVGEAKTSGNYAASLYPAKLAREAGFDQILWLDAIYKKYVQEVGTMNIFFALKDKVLTPMLDGAILKGITRDSLIKVMRAKGIEVEERLISIDELFDEYKKGNLVEIFGAGTAAVVSNVYKLTHGTDTMEFDESNWKLSLSLKELINQLRSGEIEDEFGFTQKVLEPAMAG